MTAVALTELTEVEARTLTDDIKGRVSDLLPRIREAYYRRADKALGYGSWHEYCQRELDGLQLPVSDRPSAVAELRQEGMSTRAIGSALGVSQDTVRRDLAQLNDSVQLPERIVSLDGKERPATRPTTVEPEPDAIDDVPLWDEPEPEAVHTVDTPAEPTPMPARQDVADFITSHIDDVIARRDTAPVAKPTAEDARERDYQASREAWSRNLAKCVYLLAGFSNLNGFVEKALAEWQPDQDIYPEKTTAERMRTAAAYLNAIAERWPS